MRNLARFAVVGMIAVVACSPKMPRGLEEAVDSAKVAPACRNVIPMEWAHSFPVPADDPGGRKFRIFFYPLEGNPSIEPILYEVSGTAVLDAGVRSAASCQVTNYNPKRVLGERWPKASGDMGTFEFDKIAIKLSDRTEKVGRLYTSHKPLTAKETETVREFFDLFEFSAEPLYLADYYRLNPNFWEWLRMTIGKSIAVPAK